MIIAVANLKGGCGKSTIAVNLACELSTRRNTRVTLVDADVQGTASYYASFGLLPVQCEHAPVEDARTIEKWIQRVLAISSDFTVLDAPPHVGAVTKAIVGISDLVIVPCTPSAADLVATVPAIELIRTARTMRTDGGPKCLLVPSRVDSRTTAGRELDGALKKFREPVGATIHQRAAFVDAFSAGMWIGQFQPTGEAHADITRLANDVKRKSR